MDRDTWNDLAVFAAIVAAGGFTKAGAKLGVSASALSHRIRQMEARMGVRLLNRTTRTPTITEREDPNLRRVTKHGVKH